MTGWRPPIAWQQRWRQLQLPNTAAALAALLLLPSAALLLWPRPQAVGLGRLLGQAQLMQSFGPASGRPVPGLWRQRLGPAAEPLWSRQQGNWWQFWGAHGDAGAYLVLPAVNLSGRPAARFNVPPLLVDDVAVFAADPLSRQVLVDRLRAVPRPQRGLEQRCLLQLRRPQSVYWSAAGLGALAGPVAPLLQRLQQGCLSLNLDDGGSLDFSGEAAAADGVLGAPRAAELSLPSRPLPADVLLQLQGPSLEVLLQGLLSRQLVREPLAARYGISEPQLALLRRLPFVLRLRQQGGGPFQASLELLLAPTARDRSAWARLLAGLREPLQQQGLQEPPPSLQTAMARMSTVSLPSSSWTNERGEVVGGWLWTLPTAADRDPRLLLYLGPTPQPVMAAAEPPADRAPLQLRARPRELSRLGLWPGSFPALIDQAERLELLASGGAQQPLSQLKGRLELNRSR
jgi:hypothetical protein